MAEAKAAANWGDMPAEIIAHVSSFCDIRDTVTMLRINKHISAQSEDIYKILADDLGKRVHPRTRVAHRVRRAARRAPCPARRHLERAKILNTCELCDRVDLGVFNAGPRFAQVWVCEPCLNGGEKGVCEECGCTTPWRQMYGCNWTYETGEVEQTIACIGCSPERAHAYVSYIEPRFTSARERAFAWVQTARDMTVLVKRLRREAKVAPT